MGGIVARGAAFAVPEGFPYRDLILLTAFAVVLGSLVIQGLTLRPLISALRLKDDNPVAAEVGRARAVAYRAALDEIDGDPAEEAEILRLEYRALLMRAEADPARALLSTRAHQILLQVRRVASVERRIGAAWAFRFVPAEPPRGIGAAPALPHPPRRPLRAPRAPQGLSVARGVASRKAGGVLDH